MANPISSGPSTLSENAAAANAMGAEALNQAAEKDAGPEVVKSGTRKADKKLDADPAGFSALDAVERLGGAPSLLSEASKLVLGMSGNAALDAAQAEANNNVAEVLKMFAPMVGDLAATPGKPGSAFLPDSPLVTSERLVFLPLVPLTGDVRASLQTQTDTHNDSTTSTRAPEAGAKPSATSNDSRVRLVNMYQRLADKMFTLPGDGTVDLKQMFPNLSPAALVLVQKAAEQLGQAAQLMRAQDPTLWKGAFSSLGKASALRATLGDVLEELEGSPSLQQTDIELPSPVLVKLEETAATLRQVISIEGLEERGTQKGSSGPQAVNEESAAVGKASGGGSDIEKLMAANAGPKKAADWSPSAVSGIDFKNGEIESVAMLVMMQGVKVENSLTLDLLKNLQRMNVQKDQLRKMKTQASQQEAKLTSAMQNEYNELKANGTVHATITFEQYKQWRECTFAGLSENMNPDGSVSYQLPEAQLSSPSPLNDPSVIPEWIKTGNTAKVGEKSEKDLEKSLGLPKQMLSQLERVFKTLGLSVSFEQWLSDDLGLTPAFDIDDIIANLTLAKQYLAQSADSVMGAAPSAGVQSVQTDKLQAMQKAALELAQLELLNSAFPGCIDVNKINAKKAELNAARVSPGMNGATAEAFTTWLTEAMNTNPAGEIATFQAELAAFVDHFQDVANFQHDPSKSMYLDSDDSNDIGEGAKGTGSWSYSEFSAAGLETPRASDLTYSLGSNGFSAGGSRDFTFDTSFGPQTDNHWRMAYTTNGSNPSSFNMINGLLMQNAGKSGTISIQDPTGLVAADWLAAYQPAVDPLLASQFAEQELQWTTNKTKLENAMNDAEGVINGMGDINDPNSEIRKWARKNGFDEEWNAEQAALAEEKKKAGMGEKPAADNVDPATGLALDQRGTIDVFKAKMQEITDKLDSIGALSEVESIRLQSQMEKRAKLLETLSNLLKGISQVSKTIRDNTGK